MKYIFCILLLCINVAHASVDDKGTLASSSLNSAQGLVSWAFSSLLVIFLIFGVFIALKKLKLVPKSTDDMKVLSQLTLGTKEKILKIKTGNKVILVGITAHNINYLCDVDENTDFNDILRGAQANTNSKEVKATKVQE